ncbi:CAP domain-containing protein [Blastococcus sp. CCUG 61487]|uniref:CAP domain-containing protein n=1 Tax=Blastococcus sp. CCUG 61487 TaxID=1840703 RepID=UPI0010C125BF|nr:CAP domain-containing protein [Blastococcus sp. CCUG 61487]TKJ25242.1 hypothetical protein A6V29_04260 [Blastococcus sp. CCUG 61487]
MSRHSAPHRGVSARWFFAALAAVCLVMPAALAVVTGQPGAGQQDEAAPTTARQAPVTSTTPTAAPTPAPVFPEPGPDDPQPWRPDDGPVLAPTSPATTSVPPPASRATRSTPPATAPAAPEPAAPAPEPVPLADTTLLDLVNRDRATHGCGPVTPHPDLQVQAQQHADRQAAQNRMHHSRYPGRWQAWGENVAAGYDTAAEVHEGWMGSPGHRANVLDCTFTVMGAAATVSAAGVRYWTQQFGAP